MIEMFKSDPHWRKNVITGDEKWVYGYDPETKRQSSQWLEPGEPRFKKARMIKSKLKCLLITFFDVKGLVHYEFVPEGQTINRHYYLDVLKCLMRQKRPEKWHKKIGSCIMTTHGHIWLSLYNSIWPNTELLYYPSHPILLTCSQQLFPLPSKLKKVLKGGRFDSISEIKENTNNILKCLKDEDFQRVAKSSRFFQRVYQFISRNSNMSWKPLYYDRAVGWELVYRFSNALEKRFLAGEADDTQVLCWNVNGLERMLLQFDLFTHLEKCSIFALTETWKDQHLKIKPTGFHLYESLAQRDHKKGRSSGGIIVGIREAIKDKIERTEIEKQWIMICLRLDGEMRVCLIFAYLPPNEHYLTNCKYLLDQIEGKIVEGYEVLLAGDLNTRTGAMGILHNTLHLPCYLTTRRISKDPVISTHSEQFIDRLDNNTLTILNGRTRGDRSGNYTYISARGSSVVDYCIVSHGLLGYVHDLYIEGLPHSDHLPLIIKMDMRWGPKQVSNPTSRVKKKYIWFPERATLFVEDLGGAYGFWNNSIENIMNNMVNQIKSAMVQNGMQIETKANNLMSKPWFDHECYIAKKIMKATLTKYIKSNRDLDRLEYVKTRNNYTSILNNKKKKYFCEIQEKLNNTYDSSEFWKTIARFRKRNYTQGNISISDWQQFYNKLMDTESLPDYEPVTMTFLNTDNELTKCITLNEISKEISRIRHGKATGFDDIMNEAIKALPKDYLISLKDIFNRILRTSEFPTTWLKSVIQPIFKNGDPDDPSNYRGIALLSNIAKLFTSILKSRLGSWIERRNIVPENQAGFRAAHSCQDHIFTLLSLIQMTLSRKRRKCYMFFVDLKKAFDTVPHSLLWRKLVDAGLNHRFVNLIKDYYTNMTAVVRWNNSFTAPIKVRSGVLQGEPMSPYLFILFLNDLIGLYNNSDLPGIYLPNYGYVHILLYADDIVLIGESKNNLQIKINMLRKYFETNLLTLNENKSKIVVFRNGGRLAQNDKWFWGERQLSVTTKYLYLGYPLTSGNSLNKVASHYKGKALAAIGAVWQVLTKSKMNSLNAAMRLLDSTVLPHMLYAAPCWALNQVKVVDQVQNIFLRRYLNLPKYTPGFMLRMECGRVSQEVIIIKQVLRFWVRIMKMEESRLPRACLSHLWTLHSNQRAGLTFVENLSTILDSNGFSFLKGCPDYAAIMTEIPGIIRIATEQSIQNDMAKILNTSHYSHFKYLKNSITAERYLFTTIPLAIKRFFAQLRLLWTIFPENRSNRWKTDLTLTCDLCKNRIQDEIMHIIFGCSCLEKQRKEILGDLPWSQPDCQQICSWMNTLMVDQGLSLGLYKFYKAAVNVRWRIMDSPNVVVCL
ncbi:hypothetical protein LAZ67_2003768 [Cordylochernes scorpioides]|uniref:Reverse transcriptase domain-containing protein n=1 Tax=Cordylochernes scorpioides TaxID=51811 RepID=A0ABY6K3G3_9ARAC|nr:hypothetical protein LAZ67_2003768 [Cordylochernes scorpioides]